jgi:hypothetical protein
LRFIIIYFGVFFNMKIVWLLIGRDGSPKRKDFSDRAFMAGYDGRFPLWEMAEGARLIDLAICAGLSPMAKGWRESYQGFNSHKPLHHSRGT